MAEKKEVLHVYFMPGMAANPSIFEHIQLPQEQFKVHYLKWIIPEKGESLKEYAIRMNGFIKHKNPVLIGVSFGGILVQEMSKYIDVYRLIIISSVKCKAELPGTMKFAAKTGAFKLLPTGLLNFVDHFEKVAFGTYLKKRAKLYRQYLSVRDKRYINWAIKNTVLWDCEEVDKKLIHIHGDKDEIFPAKNIQDYIKVEGGTHVMVINRFRWFNEHLPQIILKGKMEEINH
ncbi:alpha/beta hydrolase [Zunongwangia sp. F363]|uniref:Alpha/beta hydrolase n=1 Tax=Autumnicola tepida TaxID=3075595 RepID=A0ABU3CAD0_9FLAO|nr:alpha/beta hydrolase [Zunongwangia sp. F363]MDT0643286.1 alpha/beta hydrolase [Zunongwangia sp. F363]